MCMLEIVKKNKKQNECQKNAMFPVMLVKVPIWTEQPRKM